MPVSVHSSPVDIRCRELKKRLMQLSVMVPEGDARAVQLGLRKYPELCDFWAFQLQDTMEVEASIYELRSYGRLNHRLVE